MKRMTPTNMPQIELHMRWPKDWCETRASPAMDGPAPMVGEAPSLAVAANTFGASFNDEKYMAEKYM